MKYEMKRMIFLLMMAGWLGAAAQEPIEVKVEQRPSSQGVVSAFEVVVPQATPKEAIELWKKTILPGGLFKKTPKMEKVKDEWIVRDIVVRDITHLPLNAYTQVSTFPGNIYVRIFLQSEGGFLGSPGSAEATTEAATRYIREYAVALYKQAVEKELKTEEARLRKLENELNAMHRKNKSYNRKATEAQKEQGALKEEVKLQEQELENKEYIYLENAGDNKTSPQEEMEKQLKETEKDLKKAQKSQSKFERKISKNERSQRNKEDEISKQKVKVEEVKTKLTNIR
ncbi:MAG TPA: hypothetical protein P5086_10110 [Prolixibacteraceae bacterium]|nr:hypothetical protein [Prolixibacteraceae bacterium]HRV89650.1 hypothetical protein [Prolixibacteraceae bacterium]